MTPSTLSKTKRVLSGALAVWLSGVLFLVCCGVSFAKNDKSEAATCPLAKKGHCSRSAKSGDGERLTFSLKDTSTTDCCAFLSLVYNKNRKTESSIQIAELPAKTGLKEPAFVIVKTSIAVAVSYRPPFFDRSETYLKNRVFRI